MNLEINQVYTLKLSSGEEMVAKVLNTNETFIEISEPVSIAPNQQGLGMVPSLFTSDMKGKFRLNINSISVIAETNEAIKVKYIEATTGIKVPEKSIVLG